MQTVFQHVEKKDDWKIPQARSCVDIFHTIISRFSWKSQSMPLCKKDKSKAKRSGRGSCRLCLSQSRNWRRTASDQIPPLCGSRRSRPSPTSAICRWSLSHTSGQRYFVPSLTFLRLVLDVESLRQLVVDLHWARSIAVFYFGFNMAPYFAILERFLLLFVVVRVGEQPTDIHDILVFSLRCGLFSFILGVMNIVSMLLAACLLVPWMSCPQASIHENITGCDQ